MCTLTRGSFLRPHSSAPKWQKSQSDYQFFVWLTVGTNRHTHTHTHTHTRTDTHTAGPRYMCSNSPRLMLCDALVSVTISDIFSNADDSLFKTILKNSHRVL